MNHEQQQDSNTIIIGWQAGAMLRQRRETPGWRTPAPIEGGRFQIQLDPEVKARLDDFMARMGIAAGDYDAAIIQLCKAR